MFYLQYNKPLAEHFPRLEISQGRTIFSALSFLWQSPSTLTPNTVLHFLSTLTITLTLTETLDKVPDFKQQRE